MSDTTRVLPAGFVPVQATYGDEISTTDVTPSVLAKLRGESLEVTADKGLIPALSFLDKVELTEEEQEEIKRQASKECKTPNDKKCMETLVDRYTQAKLQEKSLAQTQTGGIKGERLTIIAVNSSGQQRTFYAPKGFTVLAGDAAKKYNMKKKNEVVAKRTWEGIAPMVGKIMGAVVFAFLYVFSVLTTWRNLTEYGYEVGRVVGTIIAVLVPLSGFAIQLGLFAAIRFGLLVLADIEKK
jgi:hypothetical protein